MKAKYFWIVFLSIMISACWAEQYKFVGTHDPTKQAMSGVVLSSEEESNKSCTPLPKGFADEDVVGIWRYFSGGTGVLTLTLQANGTYKQEYEYPPKGTHYKSEWKPWRLERRENGIALIVFQDMRYCAIGCAPVQGGVLINSCEGYKEVILNENETALILTGALPPNDPKLDPDSPLIPSKGIELIDPSLDPDSGPIVYRLKR